MHYKKSVLYVCFLFIVIFNSYGQDLLNYGNSLKYANYLFQNQQYKFSAIEYERVTYLEPNDTLAKLRLIQSYRLMHDFKNAKARLDGFFLEGSKIYPEEFAIENYKILFLDQQYPKAYNFLQGNNVIEKNRRIEYELGVLLMQYKWPEAKTFADEYHHSNYGLPKFNELYNITLQGMDIKYKNPTYAALSSSIIPGSGKIYTKHYKDAIFSFLFVSAFSWLTYRSINDSGLSFKSVAFGAITLSFYSANIYGSHKSARVYNKKANQDVIREVESILFDN